MGRDVTVVQCAQCSGKAHRRPIAPQLTCGSSRRADFASARPIRLLVSTPRPSRTCRRHSRHAVQLYASKSVDVAETSKISRRCCQDQAGPVPDSLYREAFACQRKLLGEDTLQSHHTEQSGIPQTEGEWARAGPSTREALGIHARPSGDEHRDVAETKTNLARKSFRTRRILAGPRRSRS
jgi:hypothetical protein